MPSTSLEHRNLPLQRFRIPRSSRLRWGFALRQSWDAKPLLRQISRFEGGSRHFSLPPCLAKSVDPRGAKHPPSRHAVYCYIALPCGQQMAIVYFLWITVVWLKLFEKFQFQPSLQSFWGTRKGIASLESESLWHRLRSASKFPSPAPPLKRSSCRQACSLLEKKWNSPLFAIQQLTLESMWTGNGRQTLLRSAKTLSLTPTQSFFLKARKWLSFWTLNIGI